MLKWITYMATEGFGNLKYNVKFKLEISSAMRGETLNSSLDYSSDPPASGRLRAPSVSLHIPGSQASQGCPLSQLLSPVWGFAGAHVSAQCCTRLYLLKTLLLLKTRAATTEEEQKWQLVQ